jgi:hypothetical protein
MGYRVTVDGGIPVASSARIETIALELCAHPEGRRYVRDMAQPLVVATFDIQRGTVTVTGAGVPMTDHPHWVALLRRLVAVSHPTMKEPHHDQDQDPQP